MRSFIRLALLAVLLLGAGTAYAAPITFRFQGVVSGVTDPGGLLDGSVVKGTPVAGRYVFEPNVPDLYPESPVWATYDLPFDNLLSFVIGNYSVTSGYKIDVVNDYANPNPSDAYVISWTSSPVRQDPMITNGSDIFVGGQVNLLGMRFDDPTGAVFASDQLPLVPPDLTRMSSWFSLAFDDDSGVPQTVISIDLQDLSLDPAPAPVPEPGSLLLLGTGVVGLVGFARRRRRC